MRYDVFEVFLDVLESLGVLHNLILNKIIQHIEEFKGFMHGRIFLGILI